MQTQPVWLLAIVVPVLAGLSIGCSKAPPVPQPETRVTDEQTIRESEIAWAHAYATKNIDRIVAQYADNGSSIIPGFAMVTGKDAIRAAVKDQLTDPRFALSFQTAKVEVSKSGDMAYTQGAFTFTGTDPKTKRAMTSTGHYVEVYMKQSDGWKIVEDIATNGPASSENLDH